MSETFQLGLFFFVLWLAVIGIIYEVTTDNGRDPLETKAETLGFICFCIFWPIIMPTMAVIGLLCFPNLFPNT